MRVDPLLSVVVPTHNRSQYALSCIASILAFDDTDLQLVVTDTSTDRRLFDLLHEGQRDLLGDPRFKYVKIDEPSNLTKNHNDAMALAEGRYICVIGDDDTITAGALDAARWAAEHDVPVVSQIVGATYAWRDFQSRMAKGGHGGRLYVPRRAGTARWRTGATELTAGLQRAFQATDGMPRCYHGIVRRDILEQVRERTGAYFHGSSPDMSGAVSISCLVDRYCEVDLPLTLPGVSGGSNSGRSAMNTHKGALSSETQTSAFEEQGWAKGVPRFFSVETVWAHAGLSSLARLLPEQMTRFDYAQLLALCELRHGEFVEELARARDEAAQLLGCTRDQLASMIGRRKRSERISRLRYLARRALIPTAAGGRRFLGGLETVQDASDAYRHYADDAKFSVREQLRTLADASPA